MAGSPSNALKSFAFDDVTINVDASLMLRAGEKVPLGPRPFEVLLFLLENRGRVVTKQELFERVWGIDFVTDTALTQVIKEIRSALGDDAQSPRYIRTVHRKGYQFIAPLDSGASVTKGRWRAHRTGLMLSAIGMLILAVSLWVNPSWMNLSRRESAPVSALAVLPFRNLSGSPEWEYLADGMTDVLIAELGRYMPLRVISKQSVLAFKEGTESVPEIARQLDVQAIVEGSFTLANDKVRVIAQLVRAHPEEHLWARTFERDFDNILALQSEIAEDIAGEIRVALAWRENSPQGTTSLGAQEAYLRGRYLVVQRTQDSVAGAVREFENAILLDPDYALAHAELAIAFLLMRVYGDLSNTEILARAERHARHAIKINPSLAEVQAAMGLVLSLQGKQEEALTYLRQAIRINPSYSLVYNKLGTVLDVSQGRYAESFPMFEKARRLDPLSIPATVNYVAALIEKNRMDAAEQELEKLSAISPAWHSRLRGFLIARDGRWADMLLADLDALAIEPGWGSLRRSLATEFAMIGLETEALSITGTPHAAVLVMLGRNSDAVMAADPETTGLIVSDAFLALIQASAGDYRSARPALEQVWQRSGRRVTRQGGFGISGAAALIAMLRDANANADVDALVTAIRDNVLRYRENGMAGTGVTGPNFSMYNVDYEEGIADFLAGDHERGIALIAKAAEEGFFIPLHEAYLQSLYYYPGFAPIKASQIARQARERKRFLSVVCNDNPYKAIWQPAEATCEQFFTGTKE